MAGVSDTGAAAVPEADRAGDGDRSDAEGVGSRARTEKAGVAISGAGMCA